MRSELSSALLLSFGAVATVAALWGLGYAFGVGEDRPRKDHGTFVYFALLIIVVPGAVLLQILVLQLLGALDLVALWLGIPMNLLPALAAGVAFYTPFARRMQQVDPQPPALSRHLRRCFGLYLLAALLGTHMVVWGRSSMYWLFGQMILWPFAAVLGGIVADAVQQRSNLAVGGADA